MGICTKYFSVMCMLILGLSLFGNSSGRPLFTPVKINFRLVTQPRIKTGSVSSADRGNVEIQNRRWGVIEIDYTPHLETKLKRTGKKEKVAGVWLDNVICAVRAVCRDSSNRREPGNALFTANVEFWTVPLNDAVHRYFVYIPPMLIERAMPVVKAESNRVRAADNKNFVIAVTFFHKKWGVLGEGYYGMREKYPHRYFSELVRTVPQNCVFHGSLVSRANSPWGMNNSDNFDLEKPSFIPAPQDESALEKAAEAALNGEKTGAGSSGKSSSSQSAGSRKNRKSRR